MKYGLLVLSWNSLGGGALNKMQTKTTFFHQSVWYLKSVCSQQFLRCSSGSVGDLADGGTGGHEDRGAWQDLWGHQAWWHRAQVGIKGSGCSCCRAGIGGQAWCHWEHGLDGARLKQRDDMTTWIVQMSNFELLVQEKRGTDWKTSQRMKELSRQWRSYMCEL